MAEQAQRPIQRIFVVIDPARLVQPGFVSCQQYDSAE
jgi:hypothetical protein